MNADQLLSLYERVAEAPDAIARLRLFPGPKLHAPLRGLSASASMSTPVNAPEDRSYQASRARSPAGWK